MMLSLVSIAVLHYLIDTEKKMVLLGKIGIDTCPERDASIKPFIVDIMDGKDFEEVQKKAKEATGKPILDLMIQSRRIHLTKVITYFNEWLNNFSENLHTFVIYRNCWWNITKI